MANGFLRTLEALKVARHIGNQPNEQGRGKPVKIYELADEIAAVFEFDPTDFEQRTAEMVEKLNSKPAKTNVTRSRSFNIEELSVQVVAHLKKDGVLEDIIDKLDKVLDCEDPDSNEDDEDLSHLMDGQVGENDF